MKWDRVDELIRLFKEEGVLEDRKEYDIEDLTSAYPELTRKEAEELYRRLREEE